MKKIYITLITLLVNVAFFNTPLNAQTATPPSAGSGTSGSPYQIANLNNLYWIYVNSSEWGKYFIQTANIDAAATSGWFSGMGWYPIGTFDTPFTGNYNGQNYAVNNLFISTKTDEDFDTGLFGYVGQGTEIKNLTLSNVNITGHYYVGGVVGSNEGTVSYCSTSGVVSGRSWVGGLVGESYNTDNIENCSSSADVQGNNQVGNLVGKNSGTMSYCIASGSAKGLAEGGVVGGLVGENAGTVSYCYSAGTVLFTSNYASVLAGGLTGKNNGSISNSYSKTQVNGSTNRTARAGGFAAENTSSVTNCYSTGLVTGNAKAGFASVNSGTLTGCFWDSQTSGVATGTYGTPLSTTLMKTKSSFTAASWNFLDVWAIQATVNSGYPFLPSWVKWQGDDSSFPTFWTTAANWSTGSVPSSSDYISISDQANDPAIFSNVTINYAVIGNGANLNVLANTLTISDDGVLAVNPGGKLTSEGTITNNEGVAGLLIESNSSGTGSVIINNSGVQATVQRYITPSASAVLFHLVSTPVSGQTISSFISDNSSVIAYSSSGGVYAMKTYLADGTGWDDYYDGTEVTEVLPGTGYSIGVKLNATTLVFKGNLVYSNQTKSIIGSVPDVSYGWNSIGNPFASSLNISADANSFLDNYGDQLDGTYYGLYIWNPSTVQYVVVNSIPGSPTYLGSSQGFIVKGKSGGGSVTFETGMRAHQSPTFYKSAKVDEDWYKIELQVQDASAKVLNNNIVFNSLMTNDLDVGYDAGLLTDNATYNLFTQMPVEANDTKFMVQALPTTWDNPVVIPVGLQYDAGGEVVISTPTFTMPEGVMVWLEDRTANAFTNLATDNYTVTLPADADSLGRFYLHIGKAVTSVEISTSNELTYCEDEVVNVTFTASASGTAYKWYKNEELIPDATAKTFVATAAGSYKVEVSVGGSSVESSPIEIIVNPLPDAVVTTTDALTYCQGEVVDVELNASPAGGLYQWYKNGEPIANAIAAGYTATAAGEYKVAVTVSGCSAESEIKEIVINELPTVTVPDDFSVCTGETASLNATGTADTYIWNNDVVNGVEFTTTTTTTYTVTAIISATGCHITDEVTITVNPLPLVNAPADFGICSGEDAFLYATGNANTYEWNNDVENGVEFTPTETTTYTVTATNTATGCQSTDEVTVTVNPLPIITLSEDFSVCSGDPVTLTASGDADAYNWDNDVVNGVEFTPVETETYHVIATVTATGCESTSEVMVTVNPAPEVILATDDVNIANTEEHLFDAGAGFDSYLWFDGSTEQTYLFVGSEWELGAHEIWVDVTNEFSCTARGTANVVVGTTGIDLNSSWNLSIFPNPSSGEINLTINGLTSSKVTVSIHNTVGQLVYAKEYIPLNGELTELINIRENVSGIYIVTVNDGVNKLTRRVVLK